MIIGSRLSGAHGDTNWSCPFFEVKESEEKKIRQRTCIKVMDKVEKGRRENNVILGTGCNNRMAGPQVARAILRWVGEGGGGGGEEAAL